MSVDLTKTDIEGLLRLYSAAESREQSAKYIDNYARHKHETDEAQSQMLAIRQEVERRCGDRKEAA